MWTTFVPQLFTAFSGLQILDITQTLTLWSSDKNEVAILGGDDSTVCSRVMTAIHSRSASGE